LKNSKVVLIVCITVSFILFLIGLTSGQQFRKGRDFQRPQWQKAEFRGAPAIGEIQSIGKNSLVITSQNGQTKSFVFNQGTQFLKSVQIEKEELKVGDNISVMVDGELGRNGIIRARIIRLRGDRKSSAMSGNKSDIMSNRQFQTVEGTITSLNPFNMTDRFNNTKEIKVNHATRITKEKQASYSELKEGARVMVLAFPAREELKIAKKVTILSSVKFGRPKTGDEKATDTESITTTSKVTMKLLNRIEIQRGARPEIIGGDDRVYIIYLKPSASGRSFKLKVYNGDLSREITSKTLVSKSDGRGNPTDIRIESDGKYLYAFYHTLQKNKNYIYGVKYRLDDNFERVAYTKDAISQSKRYTLLKSGDERLDDAPPMIEGNSIYLMTRYKTSLKKEGKTVFKIRKYDKNLNKQSEFDLDLSHVADGEARQSSIIYEDGYYYIILPTTTGGGNIVETVEWTAPSDIMMVKLNKDWKIEDSKIIARAEGYISGYVTGFESDNKYFYVTYNRLKYGKGFSSIIDVFDKNWNLLVSNKYRTSPRGLRPSIDIRDGKLYAGNNQAGSGKAEVYIFEVK